MQRSGPTDLVTCDIQRKRKGLQLGCCVLFACSCGEWSATQCCVHVSLKLAVPRNVGNLLALHGSTPQPRAKAERRGQARWREAHTHGEDRHAPSLLARFDSGALNCRERAEVRIDCAHTLLVSRYDMHVYLRTVRYDLTQATQDPHGRHKAQRLGLLLSQEALMNRGEDESRATKPSVI